MRRSLHSLLAIFALVIASRRAVAADAPAPARPPAEASAAPAPANAVTEPRWQITVSEAADGGKIVTATLPAVAPIASGFGQAIPKLVLRYRAGRTSAYVVFDTFLGQGELDAAVRFGREPAESQRWRISSDGRTAFVPGDALAFMDRLKTVDAFEVRVTPAKKTPVTASFAPHEMELVIKALISAAVKYG